MKLTVPVTVVLLMALSVRAQNSTINPGFRVILTSKGLNYAHRVGLSVLKEWLCDYTIPPFNTSAEEGLATVNYTFSNFSIHRLDFGKSSLTSDERGFVLTVDGVAISFSANLFIYEDEWPYITDYGSGNVSASGMSVTLSVALQANETNEGSLFLNVTSCSFSLHSVNLVFSGGASYLYNLFGLALNEYVKHELIKKFCGWTTNQIKDISDEYVSTLPGTSYFPCL
jgi:lipopolysaccharide-binding protein